MRVLIADDDVVLRFALREHLERWSFDVVECADGTEAWQAMQEPSPPLLAIIDWSMPGIDGPTLCRELREVPALAGMYVILLTANTSKEDVIAGLESGADDYIKKPFDWDELRARVRIGSRIVGLQHALGVRVNELQQALATCERSADCCRSARIASASAMIGTTGSRSSTTSRSTRTRGSATASARSA